ncbi:MAG TPA: phenylalanine--tRNA ligase subunit alpha [Vicinamibacterales bacterium]|nr:phenylalanine--tRNA ligase subunit alpha [Vicinamibacterales bacterium]
MDIASLKQQFDDALRAAKTEAELRALRDRYLARKGGLMSTLLKDVASAAPDQRPALGRDANQLKQHLEARLSERLAQAATARPAGDAVDVTLPGRPPLVGHRHPLTLLRERVEAIFLRMGFLILEGPELEDDYHNFEALNMPAEHPARDMQDTLYLAAPVPAADGGRPATLLRTHTSGMQIRYMETHQPPVRLIAPGRVYRRDGLDLTHSPMFTQVEGLVVGEDITLADLKGTLVTFARELFGADRKTRFRPSFFPYTEPSGELDISCVACGGTGRAAPRPGSSDAGEGGPAPPKPGTNEPGEGGCAMCKQTGWVEVLGSGMVHPAVFEAVGYDAERFTGFAFGVGIERLALLKWGVEDIRLFYENDLRFLEQFPL